MWSGTRQGIFRLFEVWPDILSGATSSCIGVRKRHWMVRFGLAPVIIAQTLCLGDPQTVRSTYERGQCPIRIGQTDEITLLAESDASHSNALGFRPFNRCSEFSNRHQSRFDALRVFLCDSFAKPDCRNRKLIEASSAGCTLQPVGGLA